MVKQKWDKEGHGRGDEDDCSKEDRERDVRMISLLEHTQGLPRPPTEGERRTERKGG